MKKFDQLRERNKFRVLNWFCADDIALTHILSDLVFLEIMDNVYLVDPYLLKLF